MSSQMPVFHAFDTQAFAVCLPAWQCGKHLERREGEKKEKKQHPLLDNLLITLQRLAVRNALDASQCR